MAKHFLRSHGTRLSNVYSGQSQWVNSPETKKVKHLVYCVNKGLSVVATKTRNQFSLIVDREDIRDQRGAFIGIEGIVDQAFQSWDVVAMREGGQARICVRLRKELTGHIKFSAHSGVRKLFGSNIPELIPTNCLPSLGGWAEVDAHHPRSLIQPHEVVCH